MRLKAGNLSWMLVKFFSATESMCLLCFFRICFGLLLLFFGKENLGGCELVG